MPGIRVYPEVFDEFTYDSTQKIEQDKLGGFCFLDGWDQDIKEDDKLLAQFKGNPQAAAIVFSHLFQTSKELDHQWQDKPLMGDYFKAGGNIVLKKIKRREDGKIGVVIDTHFGANIEFIPEGLAKRLENEANLISSALQDKKALVIQDSKLDTANTLFNAAQTSEEQNNFAEAREKYKYYCALHPMHNIGHPLCFLMEDHPNINFKESAAQKFQQKPLNEFTTNSILNSVTFAENEASFQSLAKAQQRVETSSIPGFGVSRALKKKLMVLLFDSSEISKDQHKRCTGLCKSGDKSVILLASKDKSFDEVYVHELGHFLISTKKHLGTVNKGMAALVDAIAKDKHHFRMLEQNNLITSQMREIYAVVIEATEKLYDPKAWTEEYFVRLAQKMAVVPGLTESVLPHSSQVFKEILKACANDTNEKELFRWAKHNEDDDERNLLTIITQQILKDRDEKENPRLKTFLDSELKSMLEKDEVFRNKITFLIGSNDFEHAAEILKDEIKQLSRNFDKQEFELCTEYFRNGTMLLPDNEAKAIRQRLVIKANDGDGEALFKLATILLKDAENEKYPQYKIGIAFNYIEKAVRNGYRPAEAMLAKHYQEKGHQNAKNDVPTAILYYAKEAYILSRDEKKAVALLLTKSKDVKLPMEKIAEINKQLTSFMDSFKKPIESPQLKMS